jgi:hypothetical protein
MERGILVQRSMGPRLIIVGSVDADDPAQVRFTCRRAARHSKGSGVSLRAILGGSRILGRRDGARLKAMLS